MSENSELYSTIAMEWSSGRFEENGISWCKINFINHSTPKRYRPLPTASPNLSRIEPPIQDVDEELAALMRRLKI